MALLTRNPRRIDRPHTSRGWLEQAAYDVDHSVARTVMVDLATVETIQTDDLNQLIRLNAKLRQQGRKLVICNVQEVVWQVFTVTRLDRLLDIRKPDSLDSACL